MLDSLLLEAMREAQRDVERMESREELFDMLFLSRACQKQMTGLAPGHPGIESEILYRACLRTAIGE